MNIFKMIFKNMPTRIWAIVSLAVLALFLTVTIVASTAFYDLLNLVMPGGGQRAVYAEGVEPIYPVKYSNKKAVYDAARDFNIDLCREGFVLLKNDNGALPIYTPESVGVNKVPVKPKVSIFGKNSVNIAYGGSGSGGTDASKAGIVDLHSALEGAGYEINPTLTGFYKDVKASGAVRPGNSTNLDSGDTVTLNTAETPQTSYTSAVKGSYTGYSDAAFIVFTRIGGEGFDLPRLMKNAEGARNENDHFLQLDQNETDLLKAVCDSGFKKVVVIINSGSAMELTFLEDPAYYAYQDKIDAAVWMGYPGDNGTIALGEILNGKTNPSGRTVDTYAADYTNDPTWNNFGDNRITASNSTLGGDQYSLNGTAQLYYFVDYEESVYVGYKYYETRGATDGEEWHDANVVYPFGYGLSYTAFEWEIADKSSIENVAVSGKTKYTVKVKVKNTGNSAGKEVVQLYGNPPYSDGKIEKPYVSLTAFAKTKLLAPGESDTVELSFDPYYLASYDYNDANGNGFKGYELDAGNYNLFISRNAHDRFAVIPFTVAAGGIRFENDPVTGKKVVNRYTDCENEYFNSDTQLSDLLSRNSWDMTWPTVPDAERTVSQAFINALKDTSHNNPTKFGSIDMPFSEEDNGLKLRDLLFDEDGEPVNVDGDGIPHIDYDDERWESFLDQPGVSEMISLYEYAAYKTNAIQSIGLPKTSAADGPVGWTSFMDKTTFYDTCSYCAQVVVGSAWSESLARKFGEMIGEEGLIGNFKGDKMPYSGWYAPGANIHRSPFGGRNFEYYSEDGFLSGKLAAAQIRGCQSKGVYCFIKHFVANEQETHRSIGGNCSWLTEQSLREIYLRPFEIAVKEGGTRAVMSSFNRIGTRWTGGDHRLLTQILRTEWGFKGTVLCDFNTIPQYMNSKQMAYAGGDLNLRSESHPAWCNESSAADVYVLRQCVKNVCYTVGNSNAMNGEIIGYNMPYWIIFLFTIDCAAVIGLGIWGFFEIKKAVKLKKAEPQ